MTGIETFLAANAAAISAASTAVSIGGTLLGVVQQQGQQKALRAQADYDRRIAERNREIATQNAILARQAGEEDAEDKRREVRRTMSTIRANIGASGLDLFGSPLEVLSDSAVEGELDAQRLEYQGEVRAREAFLEALGQTDRVALATAAGENMSSAGGYVGGAFRILGDVAGGVTAYSRANSYRNDKAGAAGFRRGAP